MKKNTQQTVYFEARSLTDGTRESGLTVTATISKDGNTATSATNAVSELGTSGVYQLTLTATEGVFLPLLTAELVESVDVSGLATSAGITALQTHGDSTWSTANVSGLSTLTTADIPTPPTVAEIAAGVWDEVPPILAQVVGLLGNWTVIGNTLTTYDSDGTTVLKTYNLTRDTDGEITSITGAANA